MQIKRIKNKTGLIARGILDISHRYERISSGYDDGVRNKYYFIYLWRSVDCARENVLNGVSVGSDKSFGFHCANDWFEVLDENGNHIGTESKRLLGELHFISGVWNYEVVSHELMHAEVHLYSRIDKKTFEESDGNIRAEEFICYRSGRLLSSVLKWLEKVDCINPLV